MKEEKKFLVDVGLKDLPFPMQVISKHNPEGQSTVANISITARIMQEFEARWIDEFIKIVHEHRNRIGTKTLSVNIFDYLEKIKAASVKIDFNYPFFIEKTTPVSKEKCLVRYMCSYSVKVFSVEKEPEIFFKIEVPVISTYPASTIKEEGGLFGQLSLIAVELETRKNKEIYPEDIVDIVDKHALVPVYSFLSEEDQVYVIKKIHSEHKSSVVITDNIKNELAYKQDIEWYSLHVSNYGMLHSYSTLISTDKNRWVPFSGYYEKK